MQSKEYPTILFTIPALNWSLLQQNDAMTKAVLLKALGGINGNSLNRFLAGIGQDQCGNISYKAAYVFFEKQRILEGKPKTDARLTNEQEHPAVFPLAKSKGGYLISNPDISNPVN